MSAYSSDLHELLMLYMSQISHFDVLVRPDPVTMFRCLFFLLRLDDEHRNRESYL